MALHLCPVLQVGVEAYNAWRQQDPAGELYLLRDWEPVKRSFVPAGALPAHRAQLQAQLGLGDVVGRVWVPAGLHGLMREADKGRLR
jgi:hypothetical protein